MVVNNQKERLIRFINYLGISRGEFEQSIGVALGSVTHTNDKRIGAIMLERIYTTYPKLNILWLLFGRGDMILPNNWNIYDITIDSKMDYLSLDMLQNSYKDLQRDLDIANEKIKNSEQLIGQLKEHIKTQDLLVNELQKGRIKDA